MDRRCCQRCTQSETCIGAVRGARLSGEQKEPRDTANSANCFRRANKAWAPSVPPSSIAKGTNTWSPPYLLDTGWEDFLSLYQDPLVVLVELPGHSDDGSGVGQWGYKSGYNLGTVRVLYRYCTRTVF